MFFFKKNTDSYLKIFKTPIPSFYSIYGWKRSYWVSQLFLTIRGISRILCQLSIYLVLGIWALSKWLQGDCHSNWTPGAFLAIKGNIWPFWLNESQFKICSSMEHRKENAVCQTSSQIKSITEIFSRNKSSQNIETIILYLAAHIVITAHFEEIFADILLYVGNMFIQTDTLICCYDIHLFSKKVHNTKRAKNG